MKVASASFPSSASPDADAEVLVRPRAGDVAGVESAPVKLFAVLGSFWVVLIGFVLYRWVSAPYFGPTEPGPDSAPSYVLWCIRLMEGWLSLVSLWLVWECIVKPLRMRGEMSTDGLLCITWLTLWFHDLMLNWTVHVFSYNSYALNFGNWTHEIPGWLSPHSERVPEPVLAMGLSYFALCTMGCWTAIRMMEKTKARHPQVSNVTLVLVGLFTGMFLDWACEHTMISYQLMSYLSTVPSLTLLAGSLYQFPLYEAFFFGGMVGFTGVVLYFKDDKGYTFAERGVEKLRAAQTKGQRSVVRFLALMGLFHTAMFFFYSLPMQIFSINGGPFPSEVPSYLLNGVCGPETDVPCAGPGVPIARPN
jgi:hypothetical protein